MNLFPELDPAEKAAPADTAPLFDVAEPAPVRPDYGRAEAPTRAPRDEALFPTELALPAEDSAEMAFRFTV